MWAAMTRDKTPVPFDLPQPLGDIGSTRGKTQTRVCLALQKAILGGLLLTGTKLPSTRTLAKRWAFSRETMEAAFKRLCADDYIDRKGGSGSRMSAVVPDKLLTAGDPTAIIRHRIGGEQTPLDSGDLSFQQLRPGVPFVARMN